MHLIQKLTKSHKSQEDLSTIQDYLMQLPQFQAPYEILVELCKVLGYMYFEVGTQVINNDKFAYFVMKGQLTSEDHRNFTEVWYDLENGFTASLETHCFTLPFEFYRKFRFSHGALYQQRRKTLTSLFSIFEKLNPKTQEQLIQCCSEIRYTHGDYIIKSEDSGNSIFALQFGVVSLSKNYIIQLSHYEKQVLPRKYWTQQIDLQELKDQGIIGEELISNEKALYNAQVISKSASLLLLNVQQIKQISLLLFQNIAKLHKENSLIRDELFKQKSLEIEKNWHSINKDQMLNQEMKKTLSLKVLQKQSPSFSQDQQSQTPDDHFCQVIGNLSYKKMPTFIQQYFRQKHMKLRNKKQNISIVDQTFDPYILLQKNQHKLQSQQHNVKSSYKFRMSQSRQINRNVEKPLQMILRPNTSENQIINRQQQVHQSIGTPSTSVKMSRSSSMYQVLETTPFSFVLPKTKTPRDTMFYLNMKQNYQGQKIKVNHLLHNSIN